MQCFFVFHGVISQWNLSKSELYIIITLAQSNWLWGVVIVLLRLITYRYLRQCIIIRWDLIIMCWCYVKPSMQTITDKWPDGGVPGCEVLLQVHAQGDPGTLVQPALRSHHLKVGASRAVIGSPFTNFSLTMILICQIKKYCKYINVLMDAGNLI